MAGANQSHFSLPGIDQLVPDLKRLIDEALFGSRWTREALGQLPLLKRQIEHGLNVGLTPEEVVEVFIRLTFYVGVPAVETAMRTAKEIFEEQEIHSTPNQVCDPTQSVESLYQRGVSTHREHMGTPSNIKVTTRTRKSLNRNV